MMTAAETGEVRAASNDPEIADRDHPWPYLKDMFEFIELKGDSYRLKCLLCLPRVNQISAFKTSPSNLRKHIEEYIRMANIGLMGEQQEELQSEESVSTPQESVMCSSCCSSEKQQKHGALSF